MQRIIYAFLLTSLFLLFSSCEKKISTEERLEKEIKEIREYVKKKNLDAIETDTGLFYVVEKEGDGEYPYANDNVRVRYKGYTLDGKVFDSKDGDGIVFNLQNVIKGWTQGIPKFKEGGKGILLIPSKLGYGEKGVSGIKPNTILIFDIELLTIE